MDNLSRINKAAALGGFAYLIELTMRLYSHRTIELKNFTNSSSPELESKLISHLGNSLDEEQKIKISNCRIFRNELIHSRWWLDCTQEDYEDKFSKVKEVVSLLRELTGLSQLRMSEESPHEIDWSSLDQIERYIVNIYRDVAIAATAYEIVIRNFAFDFTEMKEIAYNPDIDLKEVQISLSNGLGFCPETRELLENCRQARNKILHCDFFAAKKIALLLAPGKVEAHGNVFILKADKNWIAESVSESTRKGGGGAFGWALEGLSSGAASVIFECLSAVTKKIYFKVFIKIQKPE